ERENKDQSWQALAAAMVKNLHLSRPPSTIECLDISNISGQQAVGSLVCFEQGEPALDRFRHYKIRTVDGPNDYAMMAEVLQRRLKRGLQENDLPDLLILDGGRGQLGMAMAVVGELRSAGKNEGEKLYLPGRKNPILLAPHSPTLLYLMRIRDESHRYGLSLHRKLRAKSTLASELDAIEGIGPRKKQQLLKTLGSLTRIKQASEEKLLQVPGIGPELARQIRRHFHGETPQTQHSSGRG
ncbi:excinuclease ABC subunit C, partial [bacterium]|nr:excinuclease ABC subunit C [bacterium]